MISKLLLGMTFCHVPIDGVSLCSSKSYSVNRMLDLSSSSYSPGGGSGGLSVCKNWEQCLWTGEASHCRAGLVLCDPSAFVLCQCTAHSFTSRAHTLPQPNMGCFAPVRVSNPQPPAPCRSPLLSSSVHSSLRFGQTLNKGCFFGGKVWLYLKDWLKSSEYNQWQVTLAALQWQHQAKCFQMSVLLLCFAVDIQQNMGLQTWKHLKFLGWSSLKWSISLNGVFAHCTVVGNWSKWIWANTCEVLITGYLVQEGRDHHFLLRQLF